MVTHISKNTLYFDHLKIYRHPTVPRMDKGRNGDIILIDTEDSENDPSSVGLWIKTPLTDVRAIPGTIVIGQPGAVSTSSTITINTIPVILTDPNNRDTITDNIIFSLIPNVTAYCLGDAVAIVEETGGVLTISENSLGLYSSPPLSELNTNGMWLPLRISGTSSFTISVAQLFIEAPEEKTYTVLDYAAYEFTIQTITVKTSVGTIDVTLQINDEDTSGFSTINVTDTRTIVESSSTQLVRVADHVTIVTSNNSGAIDLSIMITYKFRSA